MAARSRPELGATGAGLACRLGLLACVAGLAVLLPATSAAAATITVNSNADSAGSASDCVLRDAITAANDAAQVNGCPPGEFFPGVDEIQFAPSVTGTISLQSALPNVTGAVDIVGPGAAQLDIHRASAAPAFRILNITSPGVDVSISGLTISNGFVQANGMVTGDSGGGINNSGDLTLDGVTVRDNRVQVSASSTGTGTVNAVAAGGGITTSAVATVTIVRSRIIENTVTATATGGASDLVTASATGGGIDTAMHDFVIDRSTVSNNSLIASATGGGVVGS